MHSCTPVRVCAFSQEIGTYLLVVYTTVSLPEFSCFLKNLQRNRVHVVLKTFSSVCAHVLHVYLHALCVCSSRT
jgi:hypothetical protein